MVTGYRNLLSPNELKVLTTQILSGYTVLSLAQLKNNYDLKRENS